MTCAQLYDRLTELMEGTLPADVCEEINRHLAECSDCPRLREDLEDLARLCREASGPTTMPEELRSRIAQMLAEPNPDQSSVGRRS
jgi:anti-sigma factor (TIGR02949 family)